MSTDITDVIVRLHRAGRAAAWIAAGARWPSALRARLRRHPIPVEARFDDCLTLTYAVPPDVLRPLLPPGLELDTFNGHAFIAVALVRTRALRPAGLPASCGRDFFLAGYRVFTRFRASDGRTLRGLRILRSDADRWSMVAGGNLLTHYNYHRCRAAIEKKGYALSMRVSSPDGTGDLDLAVNLNDASLPAGSPFQSLREARRYAGPLPYTFDYEAETHAIVAIQATRTTWLPAPVGVHVRRIAFLDQPAFARGKPMLAAAFHVSDVDYRWGRGVRYELAAPARRLRS